MGPDARLHFTHYISHCHVYLHLPAALHRQVGPGREVCQVSHIPECVLKVQWDRPPGTAASHRALCASPGVGHLFTRCSGPQLGDTPELRLGVRKVSVVHMNPTLTANKASVLLPCF